MLASVIRNLNFFPFMSRLSQFANKLVLFSHRGLFVDLAAALAGI